MARPIAVFPKAALAALTSALVLLVAACGDAASPAKPVARAADTSLRTGAPVAIQTFQFQPSPLEIGAGTTVTWTNRDDILHTVTAGTPDAVNERFGGPLDGTGTMYAFTFTEPGTYAYFCARHEAMRGEVRVQ